VWKRAAASNIPPFLLLVALNLALCWRLFKVDIANHFSSIEGSWIAIARYVSRHWGDFSWWPLWHCGMPFQDTYVPLVHLASAAVITVFHLPAGRAYHSVTGAMYALGPATLYLMAVRLGARRGAAILAALLYSLVSPSALLMPEIGRDIGGFWNPRRLQVMTVYGEGPHVSAMTWIPVVILALQYAVERRTRRAVALAAIAMALTFLTNIPGTMALGLAVFCWIAAQAWERQRIAWMTAAGAAVLGYGIGCFGVPPSSAFLVSGNAVGSMHPGFSNSIKHGPVWLALALGAAMAVGWLMTRVGAPLVWRFSILFFGLVAPMAITANFRTFELLPQVGRLHLEMEMGVCLIAGLAGGALYELIPRWARPVALSACLVPVIVQMGHYRAWAKIELRQVDLEKRSEYTSARWLDANLRGGRVYVTGSTSFWLNAFTDTPQLIGCCDQGLAMPVLAEIPYKINTSAPGPYTEQAVGWLRALGVRALVVPGPASSDEYKDIHQPERFAAVLPALHQENGDMIYGVPGGNSMAYVIRPEEQVPVVSKRYVEYWDVAKYAAAIADNARAAVLQWERDGVARIRAHMQRGDLISVQTAWFPGWQAFVADKRVAAAADGLGFIAIQPSCEGDCEIALRWTGPRDIYIAATITVISLAIAGLMLRRGVA
jgi:hypothetical protein